MRIFVSSDIVKFERDVMPDDLLQEVAEWLVDNYAPDDLFDKETLREWAFEHGLIDPEDVDPE